MNTSIWILFIGSSIFGLAHSGVRIAMNTKLMENINQAYMGRAT